MSETERGRSAIDPAVIPWGDAFTEAKRRGLSCDCASTPPTIPVYRTEHLPECRIHLDLCLKLGCVPLVTLGGRCARCGAISVAEEVRDA